MKTDFYRAFHKYNEAFIDYKKEYANDSYVESMKFTNGEYFIAFIEDKREHYVDFIYKINCEVQIEIRSLQVNCIKHTLNICGLSSLELSSDIEQIDAYVNFLIINSIVTISDRCSC